MQLAVLPMELSMDEDKTSILDRIQTLWNICKSLRSVVLGALLGCVLYGYFLAPRLVWSTEHVQQIHSDRQTAWRQPCPGESIAVSGSCILEKGSPPGALQNAGSEGGAWSCAWQNDQPRARVKALCYSNARLATVAKLLRLGGYIDLR